MIDRPRIEDTMAKMGQNLHYHKCIAVGVSGGSDSAIIVHIIATFFRQYLPKVHFVFVNTGVEYRATLKHLDFMEEHYDIHIDRVKGEPIPLAVKQYGLPVFSKQISEYLSRLQRHEFILEDAPIEELETKYERCRSGLRWWCNDFGEGSRFNIDYKRGLKPFLLDLGFLPFRISAQCCNVSKKKPLLDYEKTVGADLVITGERRCEGGARSTAHSDCFEHRKGMDRYMPLWFWNDETKAWYKKYQGIKYSDCYEVYGLKRTGCVGCPFALNHKEELKTMQKYEPKLYNVCWHIFGPSYDFTDRFEEFRSGVKKQDNGQTSLFEIEETKK